MSTTNSALTSVDGIIASIKASFAKKTIGEVLKNPRIRSSDFYEMEKDIGCLIVSMARVSEDITCVSLHEDELIQQGWLKIAELVDSGVFEDEITNRFEAFKYIKTSLSNHFRSLVQRHRFTQKRTGIKAPPKGTISFERSKPIEISLDNPESGIQVGESVAEMDDHEIVEDFSQFLTALERVVFDQMHHPNSASVILADQDMRKQTDKFSLKSVHLAAGLGMELDLFCSLQQKVRFKFKKYMETRDTTQEMAWQSAVSQLESVFGVEAPRSLDPVIIRRMFSIAARHHPEKALPVANLLAQIGARVPKPSNPTDVCFGILHDPGHRVCQGCGLREECRVESANIELTSIRLHPDVLGSQVIRVPAPIEVTPEVIESSLPVAVPDVGVEPNDRNDSILRFLHENFKRVEMEKNKSGFFHKEGGKLRYTPSFVLQVISGNIVLKFCSPTDQLSQKLARDPNGRSFRLPDDVGVKQAIKLIDQHSKDRLMSVESSKD